VSSSKGTRQGQGLVITHRLGEEGAGHSLVDNGPVVFRVELDPSLLEGVSVNPKYSRPLFRF
jgi:hypothetical protein